MIGDFPPPSEHPRIGDMDRMIMRIRNGISRGVIVVALMDDLQPIAKDTFVASHGVTLGEGAYLLIRAFAFNDSNLRPPAPPTAAAREP
jgi:hypothetical protein